MKPEVSRQPDAYDKAITFLARREYSQKELRQKLAQRGYAEEAIEQALTALQADGYQSDQRFAEMLIRHRIERGYGPLRLQAELRSHAIAASTTAAIIEASEVDWLEAARKQIISRYGDQPPADRKQMAKRIQFLARRGFDRTIARQAVFDMSG